MQEQPFTKNPQLDRFLTNLNNTITGLDEKLDEHTVVHTKILAQTTATNGKIADIQKWRERMNGAVSVMIFVVPTILAFIGWMAYQITRFDDQIQEALSVYEVPE